MKLLIITQKVNKDDQILGFFHRWILEFAKNVDLVNVICLEKGNYDLPENVKVFSLGKEEGASKIKRLFNFYKYVWQLQKNYDVVFVHMNPIYLCLAGFLFKALNKPVFLWYTHKTVDWKLKFGILFVKKIFTASHESLRIRTDKKVVTGHGIDIDLFKLKEKVSDSKKIITVGRISEVKSIDKIIDIVSTLDGFQLDIVGAPVRNKDFDYAKNLYVNVQKNNLSEKIIFSGPISQDKLPEKYNKSHIFINMSKTGSLDKVILESMSCGLQVITTNEAGKDLEGVNFLSRYSISKDLEIINKKIKELSKKGINFEGREFVVKNHSIQSLIPKIVSLLK